MEDKVQDLFNILKQSKEFSTSFADENELRSVLSSQEGVDSFYNAINMSDEFKGMFVDSSEFVSTFGLKKKSTFNIASRICFKGSEYIGRLWSAVKRGLFAEITISITKADKG